MEQQTFTPIDLDQFNFNSRVYNQIPDCPDTGFVRVVVYTGDNFQERIKQWFINAEIAFINPSNNKIVYTKEAKVKNAPWTINNTNIVTVLDDSLNPVPNPEFKVEEEKTVLDEEGNPVLDGEGNEVIETLPLPISETNLPYLTKGNFDNLSEFRLGEYGHVSQMEIWLTMLLFNSLFEYFDDKEKHYTLIEEQQLLKEMEEGGQLQAKIASLKV